MDTRIARFHSVRLPTAGTLIAYEPVRSCFVWVELRIPLRLRGSGCARRMVSTILAAPELTTLTLIPPFAHLPRSRSVAVGNSSENRLGSKAACPTRSAADHSLRCLLKNSIFTARTSAAQQSRPFGPTPHFNAASQAFSTTSRQWLASKTTPNPSIERTRSGRAGLAFTSFWAKPTPPPRAAHVKLQGLPRLSSKTWP